MSYILSVLASLTAAILVLPILPCQHWINSKLRSIYRILSFRSPRLSGRWVAAFCLGSGESVEKRTEYVSLKHLSSNELRGRIRDRDSKVAYCFAGRVVSDEVVGHYWLVNGPTDSGTLKLKRSDEDRVLTGLLTVHDTKAGKTVSGITYTWRFLPHWIIRRLRPIRPGNSSIHKTGAFANKEFLSGQSIGRFSLGRASNQAEHTIRFKNTHRAVKRTWRFLNHSCKPNACVQYGDKGITLQALTHILPQTELTIDYTALPEDIGCPFTCKCPSCRAAETPREIGATGQAIDP